MQIFTRTTGVYENHRGVRTITNNAQISIKPNRSENLARFSKYATNNPNTNGPAQPNQTYPYV